jgi:sugar phosphate isomerase/epimerase
MIKLGTYDFWFDGEPIVPGDTLEERLANLEAWGYQGIQLGRPSLELGWPAIEQALARSRIQLCIAGGGGDLLVPDPAERQAVVARIAEGLRRAAALGAVGVLVVPGHRPQIPAPAPPRTLAEVEREILVEELRKLAPIAEETGTRVILEPLNRYETHFLRRLDQGVEICRMVGSPGIALMADFFHMNIEEDDIGAAIEGAAEHLAYVHLADSNRYQPGAGHLDFRPGFAALKRIGYSGWLTLECRLRGPDKGRALVETARLIRQLWEEA